MIYFRINEQPSFAKRELTKFEYLQSKDDDKVTCEFIQEMYSPRVKEWNPAVNVLYRSIDDIDYTRVMMPKQPLARNKSLRVSHAYDSDVELVTSCNTVNSHHEAYDISSAGPSSSNECSNARFQIEPAYKRTALIVNPQVDKTKDLVNEIELAVEGNNSG
ncbi:uncharacterized protein LOC115246217 [Formica exsecta]|uniref:uncharacterized protein LOC115246217 n=1 Tax=Formica exsecta TaxID=72781 RepID=UPI001144459F|nr:uncharacterized protein LOC115246217 [Formica exsecta]